MKSFLIVLGISICHAAAILIIGSGVNAVLPHPRDIQYGATLIYFSVASIAIFPAICLASIYSLKIAISLLCLSYFVLVLFFFPSDIAKHFLLIALCFAIVSLIALFLAYKAKRAISGG